MVMGDRDPWERAIDAQFDMWKAQVKSMKPAVPVFMVAIGEEMPEGVGADFELDEKSAVAVFVNAQFQHVWIPMLRKVLEDGEELAKNFEPLYEDEDLRRKLEGG